MATLSRRSRPSVIVVGAGAAGTLVAIHLAEPPGGARSASM